MNAPQILTTALALFIPGSFLFATIDDNGNSGIDSSVDGDTVTATATGGEALVDLPLYFAVTNDLNVHYTTNFTLDGTYAFVAPGESNTPLMWIVGGGYQIAQDGVIPDWWVNGGDLNLTTNSTLNVSFTNVSAPDTAGIFLLSRGSNGFADSSKNPAPAVFNGNNGGSVSVNHSGEISVIGNDTSIASADGPLHSVANITAISQGGDGVGEKAHSQGHAGAGGAGGAVSVTTEAGSVLSMDNSLYDVPFYSANILARSNGGLPGSLDGVTYQVGESNPGGAVTITHSGGMTNSATAGIGILASSIGGAGGLVSATEAEQTDWGVSAGGGDVTVELRDGGTIETTGSSGIGVLAASSAGEYAPDNPLSGESVSSGNVTVTIDEGSSITSGVSSSRFSAGVIAISSGSATLLDPYNTLNSLDIFGNGDAGSVTVTNAGTVTTAGEFSIGLAGAAVGGSSLLASSPADGVSYMGENSYTYDSHGSSVLISNTGTVSTAGGSAHALVGISAGGGGLVNVQSDPVYSGGLTSGLIVGAQGEATSAGFNGLDVTVNNSGSITTGDGGGSGDGSFGVIAQSIGGGGGVAGGNFAPYALGDSGGSGGDGGTVAVDLQAGGSLLTRDANSLAILAQSIGGGGGVGANKKGLFVAVGGAGGAGGDGGTVSVSADAAHSFETQGEFSGGMVAQSVGGGGGAGGTATAYGEYISVGIGGAGGNGGNGGQVTLNSNADVVTAGNQADGLLAQSIGGGGGTGGGANSYSAGVAFDLSLAFGGAGGDGGSAPKNVTVSNTGMITTGVAPSDPTVPGPRSDGADSHGLVVQAIGGGGGKGGSATAKSYSFPDPDDIPLDASISIALGGSGGGGGSVTGVVEATNTGSIITYADSSTGIMAQSIGGGGGAGGDATSLAWAVASSVPTIKVSVSHGGSGGVPGDGGVVTVDHGTADTPGAITTGGQDSVGVLAQSIGGGGGAGGAGSSSAKSPILITAGTGGPTITSDIGLGGTAGAAGNGGAVTVNLSPAAGVAASENTAITTTGSGAFGVLAQSIGGGGGQAGGGTAKGKGKFAMNVAVGASGGAGGDASAVTVSNGANINTSGGGAVGIVAQSIGGGGGNGGTSDAAASISEKQQLAYLINPPKNSYTANVSVGGNGGAGGASGQTMVSHLEDTTITTAGTRAFGILAQSVSGGGGSGAAASSASNSAWASTGQAAQIAADISVGGKGGAGAFGGPVAVTASGDITTGGLAATAIIAQSIGGGGGLGAEGTVDSSSTIGLGAEVNSSGLRSGSGGTVSVDATGSLTTVGDGASGVLAQSVGGGGGASTSGTPVSLTNGQNTPGVEMTLGFNSVETTVADGGNVGVRHDGTIGTSGDFAHGVVAQSVGAGGGSAAHSFSDSISSTGSSITLGLSSGKNPGAGGSGGEVGVALVNASINTGQATSSGTPGTGYGSFGVLAQSVGGGGGLATLDTASVTGSDSDLTVGSDGLGDGGVVTVSGKFGSTEGTVSSVSTTGDFGHGVVAQSVGGSGGIAGLGSNSYNMQDSDPVQVAVGGSAGTQATGNGGNVVIEALSLDLSTIGNNAYGVVAQSIGGGGGIGFAQLSSSTSYAGDGPTLANSGGTVSVELLGGGSISTGGNGAHAVLVQSVGGSGGIVNGIRGDTVLGSTVFPMEYAATGSGGDIAVEVLEEITTAGSGAYGVVAQSVGGGGGIINKGSGMYFGSANKIGGSGVSAGTVFVSSSATITAAGDNSVAIFAQSDSAGTNGAIQVFTGADVTGGSGQGVGVWIDGGADADATDQNFLQVSESVSAASGTAVRYTGSGILNVVNNGTIVGSLDITNDQGGTGTFTNNGVHQTNADTTVEFTGPVEGSGTFTGEGTVELSGTVHPGNSPGLMTFDVAVVHTATSVTVIEIGGLADNQYDRMVYNADLTLGGTIEIVLFDGFRFSPGDTFHIAEITDPLIAPGFFANAGQGDVVLALEGGLGLAIDYSFNDGNDIGLIGVPEPQSFTLVSGLIVWVLSLVRRTRRNREK